MMSMALSRHSGDFAIARTIHDAPFGQTRHPIWKADGSLRGRPLDGGERGLIGTEIFYDCATKAGGRVSVPRHLTLARGHDHDHARQLEVSCGSIQSRG